MPTVHLRDAPPPLATLWSNWVGSGNSVMLTGTLLVIPALPLAKVHVDGEKQDLAQCEGEQWDMRCSSLDKVSRYSWTSSLRKSCCLLDKYTSESVQHRAHIPIRARSSWAAMVSMFGAPGVPAVCPTSCGVTARAVLTPLTALGWGSWHHVFHFFIGPLFYIMFVSSSLTSVVFMFNAVPIPVLAVF